MTKQEKGEAASSPAPDQVVPGRTTGFVIMSILILCVALWMQRQSQMQANNNNIDQLDETEQLTGFRADAWFLPDDELLGFVQIPAGPFIMGSNPALDRMAYENERWSNLRRQGSVELPEYYVSRFETTVAQFREFAKATDVQSAELPLNAPGNLPISNVTWPEALAYAHWLEQQLRNSPLTPAPIKQLLESGAHVTLPTEAEWEKAARGIDGRVFPWGSQPRTDRANFNSDTVLAVGATSCPECSHGLQDAAGNVWELTRSPLQDYPYDASDDADPITGDPLWVMRGGSYADAINNIRTAVRGGADPGVRNSTIGFRVIISTL